MVGKKRERERRRERGRAHHKIDISGGEEDKMRD